jgi:hypothetical protein
MKKITHFERVDDGRIFGKNENGTFSLLPVDPNHHNNEWTEAALLSHRPAIQPVYEVCKCNWCEEMSPRVKRIAAALNTPELKADFDYIMSAYGTESLDREVAEARLAGQWPGWEWMPAAIKENLKHD